MKRLVSVIAAAMFLIVVAQAHAAPITYTFKPYDNSSPASDINDLDHYKYYVWEINDFPLAADEYITAATLTFTNIYNWQSETTDKLYTTLMDATPAVSLSLVKYRNNVDADTSSGGTRTYDTRLLEGTDNQGGGDKFFGLGGTPITPVWSDPDDNASSNTLVYDFSQLGGSVDASGNIVPGNINILSTLEQYLRNNNDVIFAFDPDCHYFNDKVTFKITTDTRPVPEPGTLFLLGSGLLGLGLVRRRMRARS